jgi:bifunctional DNA-binding transcriptional regulator/antitoxin component of YhaV-PrlF toxin-antitoxin module
MHETKLTSGNRVTLLKAVRTAIGAQPGDKIGFLASGPGFQLVIIKTDPRTGRRTLTKSCVAQNGDD